VSRGGGDPGRLEILVHEVRSPAAALDAIAEAARRDRFGSSELREAAVLAVAACRSIERIVTDVAVASVRLEEVDAGSLVRATAAARTLSGARVRAEVQPGLPRVLADAIRIRQALDNLVSNALLHGSQGEVVVSAAAGHAGVLLSVTDAGVGIAPADQSRIFEAGVRLDRDRSGAGLGLAIARAIVEAHDGTLTVDSSPGRGATFTIALPLPS